MSDDAVSRLSERQIEVLRLVFLRHSSKDIARQLDISPHTVDQRIRRAMRTLGVTSRWDAARLLAAHENGAAASEEDERNSTYQRLIYQLPDGDPATDGKALPGTSGHGDRAEQERPSTASFADAQTGSYPGEGGGQAKGMPLPFPTKGRPENRMGPFARLAWILAITLASAIGFGAVISGMEALGSLF